MNRWRATNWREGVYRTTARRLAGRVQTNWPPLTGEQVGVLTGPPRVAHPVPVFGYRLNSPCSELNVDSELDGARLLL